MAVVGLHPMIELFLTYLLCVTLCVWYLREPERMRSRTIEPNLNPAVDEWNACELATEESETFYD